MLGELHRQRVRSGSRSGRQQGCLGRAWNPPIAGSRAVVPTGLDRIAVEVAARRYVPVDVAPRALALTFGGAGQCGGRPPASRVAVCGWMLEVGSRIRTGYEIWRKTQSVPSPALGRCGIFRPPWEV